MPACRAQLLGFPIQVVGVVMTPVLAVRYLVDKKDAGKDLVELVVSCCWPQSCACHYRNSHGCNPDR